MPAADVNKDAEAAYRDAMDRLRYVKREWTKAGKPLTTPGSRGQQRPHPLWVMLQDAEMTAMRLRGEVRKRHSGPEPKAVIGGSLGPSPAQKLRSVQ